MQLGRRQQGIHIRRARIGAAALLGAAVVVMAAPGGGAGSQAGAVSATAGCDAQGSCTATFTGPGTAAWTVPPGASGVTVTLFGARGGDAQVQYGAPVGGGAGAEITGAMATSPGVSLTMTIGGYGATGGFNGGAGNGGGATTVSTAGILVAEAGGGGGASGTGRDIGPAWGGPADNSGGTNLASYGPTASGQGGGAGTLLAGGAGGAEIGTNDICTVPGGSGIDGARGVGGAGGYDAGGGGGGYYGGGGGGGGYVYSSCIRPPQSTGGGGGGGSSYLAPAPLLSGGQRNDVPVAPVGAGGNGQVTMAYHQAFAVGTTAFTTTATPGSAFGPVTLQALGVGTSTPGFTTTLKWTKGTITASAKALPKGLTLSADGVVSGTPSASLYPGTVPVAVKVTEVVTTRRATGKVAHTKTSVQAVLPLTIGS